MVATHGAERYPGEAQHRLLRKGLAYGEVRGKHGIHAIELWACRINQVADHSRCSRQNKRVSIGFGTLPGSGLGNQSKVADNGAQHTQIPFCSPGFSTKRATAKTAG